jgi:hypothetical protein
MLHTTGPVDPHGVAVVALRAPELRQVIVADKRSRYSYCSSTVGTNSAVPAQRPCSACTTYFALGARRGRRKFLSTK